MDKNYSQIMAGAPTITPTEMRQHHALICPKVFRYTLAKIRKVLISGCWNREVPLYTEVSSFQGVGIEEFHCIQRCSHFRVLE